MADGMNHFFLDKISKLKSENKNETNFPEATKELSKFLSDKNIMNNFSLKELDENDMKKLLKSITGKKSLGLDWICSYSLKVVAEELLPELQAIINLSIRNFKLVGTF